MHLSPNSGLCRRAKSIVGGVLFFEAVIYLIFSSTKANANCFMTVELLNARNASLIGQNLQISGAVVGTTIQFNPDTHDLSFNLANVPGDNTVTCNRTAI